MPRSRHYAKLMTDIECWDYEGISKLATLKLGTVTGEKTLEDQMGRFFTEYYQRCSREYQSYGRRPGNICFDGSEKQSQVQSPSNIILYRGI